MENNTQSEVEKIKEEISQLQDILNCQDGDFRLSTDSSQGDCLHHHQADAETSLTTGGEVGDTHAKSKDHAEPRFSQDDVPTWSQSGEDDLHEDEEALEMEEEESGNLESCLRLNQMYQNLIKEQLQKVQHALVQNRERQTEIKNEYAGTIHRKEKVKKDRALQSINQSYFIDDMDQGPPPCKETIRRHAGGEPPAHIAPAFKWQPQLLKKLKDAVKSDGMQQLMQPILNQREVLMKKLQSIEITKEEKDEVKQSILELDGRLTAIKNLPDDELVGDRLRKVDWTKISVMDLDGKRSPFECQVQWQNRQHPSINSLNWTPEEVKCLAAAVQVHGEHEWEQVAEEVGGGRLPWQCLKAYQREIPQDSDSIKFTEEEDNLLVKLVDSFRIGNFIPFQKVGYFMNRGRRHVLMRWQTKLDPNLKLGAWTEEEDKLLKQGVAKHGTVWYKVADGIPGRHATAVRERWINSLNPNRKGGSWSIEEDIVLLEMILKYGQGKWKQMVVELAERTSATSQRSRNGLIIRLRHLVIQINKFKKQIPKKAKKDERNIKMDTDLKTKDDLYFWMRKYVCHLKEKLVKRKHVMNLVEQEKWDELPNKTEMCKLFYLSERNNIYCTKLKPKTDATKSCRLRKRTYKEMIKSEDESQSEDGTEQEDADPQPSRPKVTGRGRRKLTLMDTIVVDQIRHLLKPYARHISKERLNRMSKARHTLSTLREKNLNRSNYLVYTALLKVFQVNINVTASWIRRLKYGRKHSLMRRNLCKSNLHKLQSSGKTVALRIPSSLPVQTNQSVPGAQQFQERSTPHTTAITSSIMVTPTHPVLTNSNVMVQGSREKLKAVSLIAIPQVVATAGHVPQPQRSFQTPGQLPQNTTNSQLPAHLLGATSTLMSPGLPIVTQGSGMVQFSAPGQYQFQTTVGLLNQVGQVYQSQFTALKNLIPQPTLVHPSQKTLVTTPVSLTSPSSVSVTRVGMTVPASASFSNSLATSLSHKAQLIQCNLATNSSNSPVVIETSHTARTEIQDTRSVVQANTTAVIADQTSCATLTQSFNSGGKFPTTLITSVPVASTLQSVVPQSTACSSTVVGCNVSDFQKSPRSASSDAELMTSSVDKNQIRTQSGARVLLPEHQLNDSLTQRSENTGKQSINSDVQVSTVRTSSIPQLGTSCGEHQLQMTSEAAAISTANTVSSPSLESLPATSLVQSMPSQSPGGPLTINQSLPHGSQLLAKMMPNIVAKGILLRMPGNFVQPGVISIPGQGLLVPVQNFGALAQTTFAQNILMHPLNIPVSAQSATSVNVPAKTSVVCSSNSFPVNTQGNNQSKISEATVHSGKMSTRISLPYYDPSLPVMSRKILIVPNPGKEFSSEMLLIAAISEVEEVSDAKFLVPITYFELFDLPIFHKQQIDRSDGKHSRIIIETLRYVSKGLGNNQENMTWPQPERVSQTSPDVEGHTVETSIQQTPATVSFNESLVRLIFRSPKYWEKNISIAVDDHGRRYLIYCIKEQQCSKKCSSVTIEIRPTTDKDEEIICDFVKAGSRKKPFRVIIPGLGEYEIYEDVTKAILKPHTSITVFRRHRAQKERQLPYLAPNHVDIKQEQPQRQSVTPAFIEELCPVFSNEELTKADRLRSRVLGNTTQPHGAMSVPLLPPNLANVKAFKGLLLHRNSLHKRTEKFVVPDIIQERNKSAVEVAKTSNNTSSKGSPVKDVEEDVLIDDPLHWIRQTSQYKLFYSRFKSLFAWPALLSRMPSNSATSSCARENTQHKEA
ncbi:uncharacterized protein LOC117107992 [Anneissia japonica]|uniref:uncharacterized protein LOC117107992 n=1 Tax=Anneissia japonica TaxID=1529436 RepID=UPI001425928F|nr:uncharacterized protein LOC117107992 [Anneissia japonica]